MKPLIVANWKCNPTTLKEARQIFNSVEKGIKNIKNAEVVICPPFVYLSALRASGAQDVFWEDSGPYTGEISPLMLKNMGVKYVIIGHSERRKYFGETDEMLNKKIKLILREKLKPILCIDKLSQVPRGIKNLIIAYEPLFAIGTGKTCSPARAGEMRIAIKKLVGSKALILYGGSVNAQNAGDYTKKAGFEGLLVGGASLKPNKFIDIIKKVCYPTGYGSTF